MQEKLRCEHGFSSRGPKSHRIKTSKRGFSPGTTQDCRMSGYGELDRQHLNFSRAGKILPDTTLNPPFYFIRRAFERKTLCSRGARTCATTQQSARHG